MGGLAKELAIDAEILQQLDFMGGAHVLNPMSVVQLATVSVAIPFGLVQGWGMAGRIGIDQYVDGILDLLESAGVSEAEIEANRTREKISHAYCKGMDFEIAARAALREHGVHIVE